MTDIKTVHVVFKTHLDLGFTGTARSVVECYFERYLPAAIRMARHFRNAGGDERFVWTTGSWLIYEALERGSGVLKKELEEALAAGDVRWHALPFTTHSECLSAGVFRSGLRLSQELDRRFGMTTVAGKMTDVPGHTRAIVPLLADAGVRMLHLGVNPASTAPNVPDDFRWRVDGREVTVCYDRADYGGVHAAPGSSSVLALTHTGDNQGPQDPGQVERVFADLREQFPNATVRASTLDEYARDLEPVVPSLPVVESELGDTWIHGVGTDPQKLARYKALLRHREACLRDNPSAENDPAWRTADRSLLCVGEHTWGRNTKSWIPQEQGPSIAEVETAWRTPDFSLKRRRKGYGDWEETWAEQRAYLDDAVAALADTPWAVDENADTDSNTGWRAWNGNEIANDRLQLGVNRETGALSGLTVDGIEWADADHAWFRPLYQVIGANDYDRFYNAYNPRPEQTAAWALPDFTKPGLESVLADGRDWYATATTWSIRDLETGTEIRCEMMFDDEACRDYGAPARVTQTFHLPSAGATVQATLCWEGKQACRIPEALWWCCRPAGLKGADWGYTKLGHEIDPCDVVEDGNRHLHAVERVACAANGNSFTVVPLDSALVAPGEPKLLQFGQPDPRFEDGIHFNLLNTAWGTNFPMWSEEPGRARVAVSFA